MHRSNPTPAGPARPHPMIRLEREEPIPLERRQYGGDAFPRVHAIEPAPARNDEPPAPERYAAEYRVPRYPYPSPAIPEFDPLSKVARPERLFRAIDAPVKIPMHRVDAGFGFAILVFVAIAACFYFSVNHAYPRPAAPTPVRPSPAAAPRHAR